LRNKERTKPNITRLSSPLCLVAVGSEDAQIDHERTLRFMKEDEREEKKIITKVFEGEGHGFSMNAFEEILHWALEYIKAFNHE